MPRIDIDTLRSLTKFENLVDYLRDELSWPIDEMEIDDLYFEYEADELGIDPKHAVKIEAIKQLRPLTDNQPWGIFYLEFESKRLPVVVLRRILRALVPKSRLADSTRPVWQTEDLLFISAQGEPGYRSVSFAHFRQREGHQPELRTFSWDSRESHFYYLKNLNLAALEWPHDNLNPVIWREQWRQAFTSEHRSVIKSSQQLASHMATHARVVRELVEEVYALEGDKDSLHQLYDSFKSLLLHDLTPERFGDMVAQTVAYGLFSAATQSDNDLTYQRMVELIPNTNPFLKNLLAELTGDGMVDVGELGVEQLVDLLNHTDMVAILRDFGRQTGSGREDPVIHFYELFLSEYDREQRVQRGVFYTPDPVVSYIVRSVDMLLKEEFGLADGLADTSCDPETGEPLVQILDPATGTGTFLAHVIDQIEQTVKAKPGVDWNAYVADHLLPRLHGFELLMAPYAVAHMKLGLKLQQTGYSFESDQRLQVYLTNALEEAVERHDTLDMTGFLSQEANEAARVKRQTPITVVIGNPPYANFGMLNKGEWITGLLSDYKKDLNEKKLNLDDDFIKFIRFAQWRIEQTGQGILAFITNNTFIDGITHRRMRQSLMETFDDIYVLDLHGSSTKKEVSPDGSKDENVFDIRQGVSISVFIKKHTSKKDVNVCHYDVWMSRKFKYELLSKSDIGNITWTGLDLTDISRNFFKPCEYSDLNEYANLVPINNIFQQYISGVQTKKDDLFVAFSENEVKARMGKFFGLVKNNEYNQITNMLGKSSQWILKKAKNREFSSDLIKSYMVSPLDIRFLYYDAQLIGRARYSVMKNMLRQNVGLVFMRQSTGQHSYDHFLAVSTLVTDRVFYSAHGAPFLLPLYLYPNPDDMFTAPESTREPNLNPEFIQHMETKLGLSFNPNSEQRPVNETEFTPEDIFHYAYAVFHSPTYRSRYAEFLKIDFPRLPLTSQVGLFRQLAQLGASLVALHLLEDDYPHALSSSLATAAEQYPFVERETGTTVGAMGKRTAYDKGKIYLDTGKKKQSSYFHNIPEEVWQFHIGGYQVCHKWLYDRRGSKGKAGRTLSPADILHYQRVLVSLQQTIHHMTEIDTLIDNHGGWPLE